MRFAGIIHPGLIGTAPSHELLKIWNEREAKLVKDGTEAVTLGSICHTRPLGEAIDRTLVVALSSLGLPDRNVGTGMKGCPSQGSPALSALEHVCC